jgi:hypothetical protein
VKAAGGEAENADGPGGTEPAMKAPVSTCKMVVSLLLLLLLFSLQMTSSYFLASF